MTIRELSGTHIFPHGEEEFHDFREDECLCRPERDWRNETVVIHHRLDPIEVMKPIGKGPFIVQYGRIGHG